MTDSTSLVQRHHQYLIDRVMPKRQIHLIGGASGAGKTTIAFQILNDFQAGKDVFGYKTFPEPVIYVASDRDDEETLRTLDRMHIKPDFPCIGMSDRPEWTARAKREGKAEYIVVLEELRKAWPNHKAIVWDGFSFMVAGDQNKNSDVSQFLRHIHSYIKANDITIIGIVNAPKMKEDGRYSIPRQRISGAAAWQHVSNCILLVEQVSPEDPHDTTRNVWVCPRNQHDQCFKMEFTDQGLLAFVTPNGGASEQTNWDDVVRAAIKDHPQGAMLTRAWFLEELQIPEGSIGRVLRSLIDDEVLKKGEKGIYQIPYRS